jgi:FtsZ-interacting cell division protein ZipA
MSLRLAIIILACVLLIYFLVDYIWQSPEMKYSAYNTTGVAPCKNCESYQVHRAYDDTKEAAELMAEINKRTEKLIDHLEKTYVNRSPSVQLDPTKNNRIDVIPGTEMFSREEGLNTSAERLEYVQERIQQLVNNYSSKRVYEISPQNTGNATSYTEDKKVLVLCLRHKQPDANGNYPLHDINTMMFVVLHELTHMANKSWGHHLDFWILFKFLLNNAAEIGIYQPVDFKSAPINYCGLWLHYNPLYDFDVASK